MIAKKALLDFVFQRGCEKMTTDKWEQLKQHVKRQCEISAKKENGAMKLIHHVWQDVRNKMWSIENQEKKNGGRT